MAPKRAKNLGGRPLKGATLMSHPLTFRLDDEHFATWQALLLHHKIKEQEHSDFFRQMLAAAAAKMWGDRALKQGPQGPAPVRTSTKKPRP